MCTDEQHKEKMDALGRIEKLLTFRVKGRPAIDSNYSISDTQGFHLDYKDRKHIYMFSVNSLSLLIPDIGTMAVAANTWTNIDFKEGLKIFTNGTATPVLVLVRATDEAVA